MMPSGWEQKKLKDIDVQVIDGDRGINYPKKGDFSSEGFCLFLSAKNVTKAGFKFDECQFVSEEKHKQLRKGEVLKNDIVLTTRGTVGNMAYFSDSVPYNKMRINSGMVILRNKNNDIDTFYLYKTLSSYIMEKQISSMSFGSAQPQLTVKIINDLSLPIPPKTEQEKIAKIVSTWDEAIEKLNKLIGLKSDRYTYLRDLLTNPSAPQWSGVLGDLAIGYNGLSGKSKNDFINGNKRFVTYNSVFRKPRVDFKMCELVSLGETEKQNKVGYGDVLFTGSSETPEEVGMSSVVLDQHEDVYLNSFCFGFRIKNFEILVPQFAQHYFRSKKIRSQIVKLGQGATRYNLSRERMTQLKISFPNKSEQEKVAKLLDGMLQEIAMFENILSKFVIQKQGLMQQLLTGKKRVKV